MEEQKPMTEFELCRELNLKGFSQKRRDDGYYFIRPDMLINVKDIDCLYGSDIRPFSNVFEQLIYRPTVEDFEDFLQEDLQQVIQTNASGWFAYANSTHGMGITTRSGGETMWLALANVIYARYLEKDQKLPVMDVSESENTVEVTEPEHAN